jgi:protein arginine kinase activator
MEQCQKCGQPATVHLSEMVSGEFHEIHLCVQHAAEAGLVTIIEEPAQMPGDPDVESAADLPELTEPELTPEDEPACPQCGLTMGEFKLHGLLGCRHDYEHFIEWLLPVIETAQSGQSHHTGKLPRARSPLELETVVLERQQKIADLRRQLQDALAHEAYETAARLRDDLRQIESPGQ